MKVGEVFNPYGIFVGSFVPNALLRYKGLSSTAKLLWARLAQYAGKNGECFPSQKTLAEELGITERQIITMLKQLVAKGFIKQEKPKGLDKLVHKTSRYYFLWHKYFDISQTSDGNQMCSPESEENFTSDSEENFTSSERESIEKEREYKEKENGPLFLSLNAKNLLKEKTPLKEKTLSLDEGFQRFWSAYPRKVSKSCCGKAWQRINPCPALTERILDALEAHKETKQWQDKQYIPHPSTWLNQKRWEDELEEKSSDPLEEFV